MSEIKSCPKCGKQLEAFGLCPYPGGCGHAERYGGLYRNPEANDTAIVGSKRLAAVRELVMEAIYARDHGAHQPQFNQALQALAAVWPEAVEE